MAAPFDTLALTEDTHDLYLDGSGNIAVLTATPENPVAALEQDVACACLTFKGEVYYDSSLGIRYTQQILGKRPPLSVMQSEFQTAALTVPYVDKARLVINSFTNRRPVGQIQFTDDSGNEGTVGL